MGWHERIPFSTTRVRGSEAPNMSSLFKCGQSPGYGVTGLRPASTQFCTIPFNLGFPMKG